MDCVGNTYAEEKFPKASEVWKLPLQASRVILRQKKLKWDDATKVGLDSTSHKNPVNKTQQKTSNTWLIFVHELLLFTQTTQYLAFVSHCHILIYPFLYHLCLLISSFAVNSILSSIALHALLAAGASIVKN